MGIRGGIRASCLVISRVLMPSLKWEGEEKGTLTQSVPIFRKCIRPHWSHKRDLEKQKFEGEKGEEGKRGSKLGRGLEGVPFHAD